MPEASTNTAAAADDDDDGAVAVAPTNTGALGSQGAAPAVALAMARASSTSYESAAPRQGRPSAPPPPLALRPGRRPRPLLRSLSDAARARVAVKADSHAAAARYVGRAYLNRCFLFSLDFGPEARSEQRQTDEPPAFEELAADVQVLLDAAVATGTANGGPFPPPLPKENDPALSATVDAIEADEATTEAAHKPRPWIPGIARGEGLRPLDP